MVGDDEHARQVSGSYPKSETPTHPGVPAAKRRESVIPREGWGFHRAEPDGPVSAVSVICGGCHREFRMAPPRFAVDDTGEVVASDEGAAFRCTTCDTPIGPLRLADWRLGRM